MSTPLSPMSHNVRRKSTLSNQIYEDYDASRYTTEMISETDSSNGPPSSPFLNTSMTDENMSPSAARTRPASVASPTVEREAPVTLKPLKSIALVASESQSPRRLSERVNSPRKMSTPHRFPVKPSSPDLQPVRTSRSSLSISDVLRDNEGLTKAIEILEDEANDKKANEKANDNHNPNANGSANAHVDVNVDVAIDDSSSMDDTLTSMNGNDFNDAATSVDDTFVSTFSAFSAVPDMTMFAKLGHTPSKRASIAGTPRRSSLYAPATARRPFDRTPSPTPKPIKFDPHRDPNDTTNLLDFTEQLHAFSAYAQRQQMKRVSPSKSVYMADSAWGPPPAATPSRNTMSNLLDFDIPPAPTPRSLPSITPRELESLKSQFLSEISSLKASLSGKEAEVLSLKTAVGDAEKRVGDCMEQLREEEILKDQLAAEKELWEQRGREMEAVLRNVKEEILLGEQERDDLEGRLEESERRREAAEMMAQEAESKAAALRAGRPAPSSPDLDKKPGECICEGKTVELAVEKVSRELHTLYREKHETKVAALKKSYEKRWEKKVKELETSVEELTRENEELRRDLTLTKVEPKMPVESAEDREKQAIKDAKMKELFAEVQGLTEQVKSVEMDNDDLRRMLDEERVEKGKLVQAVDEMIPLVQAFDEMLANMDGPSMSQSSNRSSAPPAVSSPQPPPQPAPVENLRGSVSRASGLRAPGSVSSIPTPGESRIGRGAFGANHGRTGSGIARPGSGLGKSGIMSSIEKMGAHRGRGE
ncbi:hypothetical protein F5884DRAFT_693017 [Xylogone sp. PMI_703]|nr:hypothetical protein F5884DRAFT_693017 [Xylogone sp. PMI_703]